MELVRRLSLHALGRVFAQPAEVKVCQRHDQQDEEKDQTYDGEREREVRMRLHRRGRYHAKNSKMVRIGAIYHAGTIDV